MVQDYDLFGKNSAGSVLNSSAVDGQMSVCHTNAPTIKFSHF